MQASVAGESQRCVTGDKAMSASHTHSDLVHLYSESQIATRSVQKITKTFASMAESGGQAAMLRDEVDVLQVELNQNLPKTPYSS